MTVSAKMKEIMENKAYAEEIDNLKTPEEAAKYFADKGVNLEAEYIAMTSTDELNEESLDKVSGGIGLLAAAIAFGAGAYIGVQIRKTYDKVVHGNANYTYK